MLTLILLVVLGGGVGLLAVSLAESTKPATDGSPRRRADAPEHPDPSDPVPAAETLPDTLAHAPEPATITAPVAVVRDPVVVPSGAPAPVPHASPAAPGGLPRRVERGSVPKAYTAVEGRYQDVIRPSLWRRLVSLALILVIVVAVGVTIAAILGGIIGAVAEVLGNTIG